MEQRKLIFCCGLALVCSAASWGQTTATSGAAQTQQAKPDEGRYTGVGHLRKPSKFSGAPIVGEYQESQPESAADSERRHVREKRYEDPHLYIQFGGIEKDPGLFVNGEKETSAVRIIDYIAVGKSIDPDGIPVSISAAVVLGTITGGKCFITKNRTYVYTDYSIRVDQILKQDKTASLTVGGELIGAREGGAIRFPSGHITNVLTMGHGLPEVGSQYVLFLAKNIPGPEYEIIFDSGYQVKDGRIYPLDDANPQYSLLPVAEFLEDVQKAITASQNRGGVQ
jgi:hypothetical protein